MVKLFNEYYTKKFGLPGRFTAMNGAIQYFELTASVSFEAPAPADPEKPTVAEAKAIAAAQGNYLRVLEVLRSRGAQPVITYVDDKKLGFTLEQTWVYGERGPMQVSAHFGEKDGDERSGLVEDAYVGLKDGAEADIRAAFAGVKALEAKGEKLEDIVLEDKSGEDSDLLANVEVKTTIGSLVADK